MNKSLVRQSALATVVMATAFLAACAGCTMCCGPYDYHYPTYGGRVQRADPEYGRVGSIFSDPYTAGTGPSADSNLSESDSSIPSRSGEAGNPNLDNRETSPLPKPQPDGATPKGTSLGTAGDRETENQWQGRQRNSTRGQWR